MPSLARKASAFAVGEFETIMRGTSRVSELSRHGGVRAPALPATTAFRRHGFRDTFVFKQRASRFGYVVNRRQFGISLRLGESE